jgi:hypothetical protein
MSSVMRVNDELQAESTLWSVALHLDPNSQPDREREDELSAKAARVELRPSRRLARLAMRSLACPSCGVPVALSGPVGWDEPIACAFCESAAPTSEYVREEGWPRVELIARLG